MVCRVVQMVNETHLLDSSSILREVAGSSPATATTKTQNSIITMTIEEKEIRADFERFIRHEAMRANVSQDEIKRILVLQ